MNNTQPLGDTAALVALAQAVQATGYHFVTPTPATHARVNARVGSAWAEDLRGVFGWSRPFRAGIVPDPIMEAMDAARSLVPVEGGWRSLLRLSSLDGLLFLHSAFPTEAAESVFFGPDTYRFAQAIEAGLPAQVRRAVDIGCGAGPGAVVIARARPETSVVAADINDDALRLTRANALLNGVTVDAVNSNLFSAIPGTFDLVVANPPYLIDPNERAYRHGGGDLGAGLSLAILGAAIGRLSPGGTLLLYSGAAIVNGRDPLHIAAADRLARTGLAWTYRELDPDVFGDELAGGAYAHADRIAAVVLTVRNLKNSRNHADA